MSEEHLEVTEAKRKRHRRKKKKSSTAADKDSVTSGDNGTSVPPSKVNHATITTTSSTKKSAVTMSTPQECLRQSLIGKGFSADEIDRAMEIMWDNGLAYDEFDAVLKFLQCNVDVVTENGQGGVNEEKESGDQGTVQTVSTDDAAGEGESFSNSPSIQDQDDDMESASKVSSSSSSTVRKTTIAEKLDIVARADKVTDAIFALTQWINKAAKPHEVRETKVIFQTM
jgi:hypothetical protein